MHGTMTAIRNRKGRKRKQGARRSDGRLIQPKVNYLEMAANNPDRRDLPEGLRTSEKAASALGKLCLYRIITEQQYEAGRRFCVIAGAFRSAIQPPRSSAGHGRGHSCNPESCLVDSKGCICEERTRAFNACHSVLIEVGQGAYNEVYRTAVSDMPCELDNMPLLIWGLNALARYFGIDTGRKM